MPEVEMVDPNVRIPRAVQAQTARANEIIEQLKQQQQPGPGDAPVEPVVTATVTPPEPPEPAQTPPAAAAPEPPAPVTPPAPDDNDQTWKQRYHSMDGRYKQAMSTISGMQSQMRDMGDEMLRLQDFVKNAGGVANTPQPGQPAPRLITDKDREVYGDDLLDVVTRAAKEVVGPELEAVKQENQRLNRNIVEQRKAEVFRALDVAVPNWREINRSQRFKDWLSLTNLLAGSARGKLLNDAFKAADAPRVAAFFSEFVQDEIATGSTEFAPRSGSQPQPQAAPRTPAVALEALAAPGRAKAAAVDTGRPVEKPVFTRAQIRNFYDQVRRGYYAGREQEKSNTETAIFAAQSEGRIRN